MSKRCKSIVSGMSSENHFFRWRIRQFEIVISSKSLTNSQKFEFEAGDTIDHSSKWQFFLKKREEEDKKWLEIMCKFVRGKETISNAFAYYSVEVKNENGDTVHQNRLSNPHEFVPGDTWGWTNFLQVDLDKKLQLVDGDLVLDINFTIYAIKDNHISDLSTPDTIYWSGLEAHSKNNKKLFSTSAFDDLDLSDVKIITKDKKEFKCHKVILAAQCPVFASLFRSKMKETSTGEIHLDDISGHTLKILLHYFYTGVLMESWSTPVYLVEFTYAVGKYQLKELLQFLDNSLGKVCTQATAVKLLTLANQLNLEKAKKAILERIKDLTTLAETTEDFLAMIIS